MAARPADRRGRAGSPAVISGLALLVAAFACAAAPPAVTLRREDRAGTLAVVIAGRETIVYRYGADLDLPHFWPMAGPSGRNLLVEHPQPYPHHRAFWFADTVRLAGGREVSTYMAYVTGRKLGEDSYGPPFRDHVRHVAFPRLESRGDRAEIRERLVWEMDGDRPVLDEKRLIVVHVLGDGEYLLDLTWTLTAAHGEVEFTSDAVHYAWPYLRLAPPFSGENGGVITADDGRTGEKGTTMQPALWIDYSSAFEGIAEGVAVFQWPDGASHRWLTREYGTFGPRRPDDLSGKPFTLRKGKAISQRVGVLVHRGDVRTGRVGERYAKFIANAWH
jgi:hypothetical protein